MPVTINESDWKIFRQQREVALERFCQRVLSEIDRLSSDAQKTSHERYLAIYNHIKQRDEELALAFNNPRRSIAMQQLVCIQSHQLLTEEEILRFSQETLDVVKDWLGARFPHT
jgi:hypothetical protein